MYTKKRISPQALGVSFESSFEMVNHSDDCRGYALLLGNRGILRGSFVLLRFAQDKALQDKRAGHYAEMLR